MAEQQAREKTETLVDYATTSQARIGEPMTLDALSGTDGRAATAGVLRLHPQQGLWPVAGNPGGQAHPQPVPPLPLAAPKACRSASRRTCWDPESSTTRSATRCGSAVSPTQLRDQPKRRKAQIGE